MRGLSWCCLPSLQCGEGAGESCSHPCSYHLQLLREQTPAPAETLGKAGPAPCLDSTVEVTLWMKAEVSQPENVSMGDLAPPLICRMVAWVGERSPPLINFSRDEGVRPEVIRVQELPLLPISCSTEESRRCTLPGQHNRADPVYRDVNASALKLWAWASCPHAMSVMQWWGRDPPFPSHFTACHRQVSWPSPLPDAAFRKVSSSDLHLGNTVEPTLLGEAWVR